MDCMQQLSESARRWLGDLSDHPAYWVMLVLLLVVCVHYLLMSTIWLRLLVRWRGKLFRLFDPDVLPKDSPWRRRLELLATWFQIEPTEGQRKFELSRVRSYRVRSYRVTGELGMGDVCDVFVAKRRDRRYVLKQSRTPDGNALLKKEYQIRPDRSGSGGKIILRLLLL